MIQELNNSKELETTLTTRLGQSQAKIADLSAKLRNKQNETIALQNQFEKFEKELKIEHSDIVKNLQNTIEINLKLSLS